MLPVQVTALPVMASVPEVAVWSPLGTASSNTSAALVLIVILVYGVCPVLVNVAVNRTTLPGVVEATFAVLVMASWETVTVDEQAGAVPPDGQLFPAAAEVSVTASR